MDGDVLGCVSLVSGPVLVSCIGPLLVRMVSIAVCLVSVIVC